MLIFTKTRDKARQLINKRKANGYPASLVDCGKNVTGHRYAVNLHPTQKNNTK